MKNFIIFNLFFLLIFQTSSSAVIKINKLSNDNMTFEKMEMIFDESKIYTHRPGGITQVREFQNDKQLDGFF
jgi:hypothetical protein